MSSVWNSTILKYDQSKIVVLGISSPSCPQAETQDHLVVSKLPYRMFNIAGNLFFFIGLLDPIKIAVFVQISFLNRAWDNKLVTNSFIKIGTTRVQIFRQHSSFKSSEIFTDMIFTDRDIVYFVGCNLRLLLQWHNRLVLHAHFMNALYRLVS